MRKSIYFLLFLMVTFFWNSCQNDAEKSNILYHPIDEKLDPVCRWLIDENNYTKKEYSSTFYNYYKQKISKQQFAVAAKALEIVAIQKAENLKFDADFTSIINNFSIHYKRYLNPQKTTFLDAYLGSMYCDNADFKKSIYHFTKITKIPATDYYSMNNLGEAYYNISFDYVSIGEHELALKFNLKAQECYNRTDDFIGKASVYENFSSIYLFTKKHTEAVSNINNSIIYSLKAKDTNNAFMSLHNKIVILDQIKYDKKYIYKLVDSVYFASRKVAHLQPNINILLSTFYIQKFIEENKLTEAKEKLDQLKPIVEKLNSESSNYDFNTTQFFYELKSNDLSTPEKYLKTLPVVEQNQDYQNVIITYSLLRMDALNKNDYKNALHYTDKRNTFEDKLSHEKTQSKVFELEEKYKAKQKEQQLAQKELQIQKNKNLITILIIIIIAIILGIIILYLIQSQKKLQHEKSLKNMFTKQLFESTEEERKRIANDLHDGISHELLSLKKSTSNDFMSLNSKIDTIINEIRQISRNLHPAMFDRVGLEYSIKQLVEYLEVKNQFIITTEIRYYKSLSSEKELQLYRIIQESLSNILKYAEAFAAKITLIEEDSVIVLEIKDNGKGFDVDEKLKSKTAFGLYSIMERSTILGGKATIHSDKNGTIITVKIIS